MLWFAKIFHSRFLYARTYYNTSLIYYLKQHPINKFELSK